MRKRVINQISSFLVSAGMLLGGLLTGDMTVQAGALQEIPDRMKLITKTDKLELYFDEERTDIAVRVTDTGDVWFSNPEGAQEDEIASAYHQKRMQSQFSVKYYNENVQAAEMDNFNDSISSGQFEVEYLEDGVRITYTLGETAEKYILPQVINETRFQDYLDRMDKDEAKKTKRVYTYLDAAEMKEDKKKEYLEKYPSLAWNNLYVLQEGTKDYKKEEITGYFAAAGYTAEDMARDNEDGGFSASDEKPWFQIPLEYHLEEDNLIAQIDPDKVTYNSDSFYLVDIDLLEFFGAADATQDGYLFVPDGSGALIYLDRTKKDVPSYIGTVYGQDVTNLINMGKKSEVDQSVTVRLPVFGLKSGEQAWFAVIEGSEARAEIHAEAAGNTGSYNHVYAGFSYLSYGSISLGDVVGTNSFQMYSRPEFTDTFQVRFGFLHGEDADYTGMAHYYQDYLAERGALVRQDKTDGIPMYLNLIGAVDKLKSVMGIKHRAVESMTTYAQATQIVNELQQEGVEHLKISYAGWSRGGFHGTAPRAAAALRQLEDGGVTMDVFLEDMEKRNIPVFHTAQLQYVYKDVWGDDYNPSAHSPRYYDKTIVKTGEYLIPNGILEDDNIDLISPYFVNEKAQQFVDRTEKYALRGVSVGTLTSDLFSDFADARYTDRDEACRQNAQVLDTFDAFYGRNVMGSNSNAYTLAYLSDVVEVPFDSNRAQIIDEVIPFYGMVLHGYKDFAGQPLNMADDYATMVLKSVECGAGVSFEWIYEDNQKLKNTDYDDLYSVNYGIWKEKAVETWKKVNDAVGGVQGQLITDHRKLAEGVFKTTFEDGSSVIVNYNTDPVVQDGKTIEAQDFIVERER